MEQCKAFIIMVGTANTSSTLSSVFLSPPYCIPREERRAPTAPQIEMDRREKSPSFHLSSSDGPFRLSSRKS